MKRMIKTVQGLRGFVSEPVRARVAFDLANMVSDSMDDETRGSWALSGQPKFMSDCGVTCCPAAVPDSFEVKPTDLAKFINRWTHVVYYKRGDKFVVLSEDMNAIRTTIIEELKELCDQN